MTLSSMMLAAKGRRYEIRVEPEGHAWRVRACGADDAATFSSGWQAEVAARTIARSLANLGRYSIIRIFIRGGELVGTILAGPDEPLLH